MKRISDFFNRIIHSKPVQLAYPIIAPLVFGLYPALYYYTKNATMIKTASLGRVVGAYFLLILALYLVFLLVHRFNGLRAANSASVFLLFFNTYGIIFNELRDAEIARMEHLTLLPFFFFLAFYAIWLISRLKKKHASLLWKGTSIVFSALLVISLIRLFPIEVDKARAQRASRQTAAAVPVTEASGAQPDIYYLIFDEFSGFAAMRQYFHTKEVEGFKAFLEENDFVVFENSFASSNHTVHQMAVRMNYEEYEYVQGGAQVWHDALTNSRGFALLESKGYTTVVFEEISMLHPNLPDFKADYLFHYNYSTEEDMGILFDEYGMLVADNTMLYAFDEMYKVENPGDKAHKNFLDSMQERLPNLSGIPSPKFVYAHFMIPHQPFLFDRNGGLVDSSFYRNWNYYEGHYIYTMKYIEKLITKILANADPENPPLIILQSDHGARIRANNLELSNYPQDMLRNIMFAVRLPGFDTSTLTQDENPINTLPIIFNHVFGENIPLQPPNQRGVEDGDE